VSQREISNRFDSASALLLNAALELPMLSIRWPLIFFLESERGAMHYCCHFFTIFWFVYKF